MKQANELKLNRQYAKDDIEKVKELFRNINEKVASIDKLAEQVEDSNYDV